MGTIAGTTEGNDVTANVGQTTEPETMETTGEDVCGLDAEVYAKATALLAACRETNHRAVIVILDGSNEATILGGISAEGAAEVFTALASAARESANVVTELEVDLRPEAAN